MKVLKFGGSSVANTENIKEVVSIVKKQYQKIDKNLTIVVSAQSGITDLLSSLCEIIPLNFEKCAAIISEIETRHLITVKNCIPISNQSSILAEIMAICNELLNITKGASLVGEITLKTRDLILSFGERLSAYTISKILQLDIPNSNYTDARQIIKTNSDFGHAIVDFELSNKLIQEYYSHNKGLNVVTGFIASNQQGNTTTLGRSGSDYTASIIGAAINASIIEIWTDVNGVMTADPRFVKEAQSIDQLTYVEAMELSHFGAKVIFPATMQPVMAKKIPIVVKNTFNPNHKGTIICNEEGKDSNFIKGISSLKNMSLISIEGSGMLGVAGISAKIFTVLSSHKISVNLISQASSEHSICFALPNDDSHKVVEMLRLAFQDEIKSELISSIYSENNLAIVAVVGENMRKMPGVSARVFNPLGRNGINVKAISQGCSELNISIVIEEKDLKKTLNVLHQSLFKNDFIQLHLYIAGVGAIGSKLLSMIDSQTNYLASQKIQLKLCGCCNSKQMIINDYDLNFNNWKNKLNESRINKNLTEFTEMMIIQNLENSVFIDVTASNEPIEYYNKLLQNSIAIVTANKRANTQSFKAYQMLHESAKKRNTPFHYETNVGAGLPIINVLNGLKTSGDSIHKIEAVLSGTMNYLLSEYNGELSFSELVKKAKENNITEPDPRDDLSGMDVARKCLILARECGWKLELEDIEVESMMDQKTANAKDITEFFNELKNEDSSFLNQYQNAESNHKKMRYVANLENGKAKVSTVYVDTAHPFYNLKGTENCISITSKYYQQYPMVIKGPGAGVDVTAVGVFADIIRITEGLKI